jgi:hypothetical protein
MPHAGGRPEPEQPESAGSASADELATVRRTARRGLITAIAAPLVLGAVSFAITYAYRLCFASDRLIAKDVVQTGSVEPTNEGTPSR